MKIKSQSYLPQSKLEHPLAFSSCSFELEQL